MKVLLRKAQIRLQLGGEHIQTDREYTLAIQSFIGSKKADAPLKIKGNWECKFKLN